MTCKQ